MKIKCFVFQFYQTFFKFGDFSRSCEDSGLFLYNIVPCYLLNKTGPNAIRKCPLWLSIGLRNILIVVAIAIAIKDIIF